MDTIVNCGDKKGKRNGCVHGQMKEIINVDMFMAPCLHEMSVM
jgi:hypothetical protein